MSKIDWKALEFSCIHERDLWPPYDPEADVWFKEARRLEKTNDENNYPEAARLYHKAAERNHYMAINNLVVSYLHGDGVEPSEAKAVELAERLMTMNIGGGYYHMGVFLEQGIGVKQDRAASLAYFREAADLGNAQGQLVVGKKLTEDFLLTPIREQAVSLGKKMLECSLGQDFAPAGHELGMHYAIIEKKSVQALHYFQQAGKLGYSDSLYKLYSIFSEGEYGVQKDPVRAGCYDKLWREANHDKSKRYPNLDDICPLPPAPMPGSR